ncbi:hypothetical protein CMALT430_160021 [Carnobacterium maltaromaticum]|nr:hypothetical protein CMALT430_160021 [Carnobacterium maltaromaticum]
MKRRQMISTYKTSTFKPVKATVNEAKLPINSTGNSQDISF